MKRDDKLLQEILKVLEESEHEHLSGPAIRTRLSGGDAAKDRVVTHHLHLLEDKGLINATSSAGIRLTWDGHDALKAKSSVFSAR